jgi:hypothetical protein
MTPRLTLSITLVAILSATACDSPETLNRLDKQVQELQAQATKNQSAIDFDMQAKCSKDAKAFFNEGWGAVSGKTILLDHSNHYNRSLNKCFTEVEYHYSNGNSPDWTNDISLWDIYENSKYATFAETHNMVGGELHEEVIICEGVGKKCKNLDEFNAIVRPFVTN